MSNTPRAAVVAIALFAMLSGACHATVTIGEAAQALHVNSGGFAVLAPTYGYYFGPAVDPNGPLANQHFLEITVVLSNAADICGDIMNRVQRSDTGMLFLDLTQNGNTLADAHPMSATITEGVLPTSANLTPGNAHFSYTGANCSDATSTALNGQSGSITLATVDPNEDGQATGTYDVLLDGLAQAMGGNFNVTFCPAILDSTVQSTPVRCQ